MSGEITGDLLTFSAPVPEHHWRWSWEAWVEGYEIMKTHTVLSWRDGSDHISSSWTQVRLESQIIWGCDGVWTCSDLLTREPLKLLNIVIRTDIHKDTHIGFQWIRGLRIKQLKKTHTHARTHSWFIFIASHKLTAGHWQSAFVQSAITAWQRASIYGESAGQDDSGGARAVKSP